MKLFVQTGVCTSRANCPTCRDPGEVGRTWRLSLAKVFELPDDDVNFDCPYGVPWGEGEKHQVVPMRGTMEGVNVVEFTGESGCCGG